MAHGPDTVELLSRIGAIQNGILDTSLLNITSLPKLPETLRWLNCENTQLSVLPTLPETLICLSCGDTNIHVLPELPETLRELYCENIQLSVLPELPETLICLFCGDTQLSVLPILPETLKILNCENTPLILQRNDGESIADYSKRWDDWHAEQAYIKRCNKKCRTIRDELIDIVEFATFCGEFFLE